MGYVRTLTISVNYVQGRRITCEYCDKPFTYLVHGSKRFKSAGLLFAAVPKLKQNALAAGVETLVKIAATQKMGRALCPHCKRYQRWMVEDDRVGAHGCGCLLVTIPSLIVLIVVNKQFRWDNWRWLLAIVGVVLVGNLIGLFCRTFLAITPGPHPHRTEPLAKTDEELLCYLTENDHDRNTPLLTWLFTATKREPSDDENWISLGVFDQTPEPLLSEEQGTDAVLQKLKVQWTTDNR